MPQRSSGARFEIVIELMMIEVRKKRVFSQRTFRTIVTLSVSFSNNLKATM